MRAGSMKRKVANSSAEVNCSSLVGRLNSLAQRQANPSESCLIYCSMESPSDSKRPLLLESPEKLDDFERVCLCFYSDGVVL
eukprot:513151-Hanusia_phi.AAC.3